MSYICLNTVVQEAAISFYFVFPVMNYTNVAFVRTSKVRATLEQCVVGCRSSLSLSWGFRWHTFTCICMREDVGIQSCQVWMKFNVFILVF
jgi:hypothetical protein